MNIKIPLSIKILKQTRLYRLRLREKGTILQGFQDLSSKIRDVLFERCKIVTICQFEYINTKMECQRVAANYLDQFFGWFFSESKAPVYVPVLISGWEMDKLICHIFFDDTKKVIHIPACDLRYFGTLWTFTLVDDL